MKFLVTGGTGNVAPEGGGASPAREDQATPPISRIGYFVPDERPDEILRHVLAMTKKLATQRSRPNQRRVVQNANSMTPEGPL